VNQIVIQLYKLELVPMVLNLTKMLYQSITNKNKRFKINNYVMMLADLRI